MNARAIFAIVRKDLKVVSQNKGVMLPIILLPLILFVVLPWGVTLMPSLARILPASVISATSEPVAIRITLGRPLPRSAKMYAPFARPLADA